MGSDFGIGIIGMGFMGATHTRAWAAAADSGAKLVAVCDSDPERRLGLAANTGNIGQVEEAERLFDPEVVRGYESADELFADDAVDAVSICTHTDTHVDIAIRALAAGKHVLVEKPVALRSVDVARLASAAANSDRICMPAQCVRFWPGWDWLKARIDDGALGAVKSAVFRRLGSHPAWSPFYKDIEKNGGALIDLHLHDSDFVSWCFGIPDMVSSTGSLHHVTTLYGYADGPEHVVAEGGWNHTLGFPFRMQFTVVFDEATADFDIARDTPLMLGRDGEFTPVEVEGTDGYEGEVRHFVAACRGEVPLVVTMDQALAVSVMLEAERASLTSGQPQSARSAAV